MNIPATSSSKPDVVIRFEGKIFLFTLLTLRARRWVHDSVSDDAQFFGDSLVVEDRYATSLATAMADDGLVIATEKKTLRMPRFSRYPLSTREAISELLLFAEEKRRLGEEIGFDDLPVIRDEHGQEHVVLVQSGDFSHLICEVGELSKRNAIVLSMDDQFDS
jgi:hypothetical protein